MYLAIIGSIIAVAVVDSLTPNVDEWMLYYIPLVLSFALFRPALPIGIAIVTTILIIVASVLSPPVEPYIEAVNRILGVLSIMIAWAHAGDPTRQTTSSQQTFLPVSEISPRIVPLLLVNWKASTGKQLLASTLECDG